MAKRTGTQRIAGEDTRARSVRLANRRVSSVLKYMDLVGNLGGVGYQLTEDEKMKMVTTIQESLVKLEKRMSGVVLVNDRFKL